MLRRTPTGAAGATGTIGAPGVIGAGSAGGEGVFKALDASNCTSSTSVVLERAVSGVAVPDPDA